jgi:hypothetical protein
VSWRILTGGQTGVDQGAMDGALAVRLAFTGYAPKGWTTEDGEVPERFRIHPTLDQGMFESRQGGYLPRTIENVGAADLLLLVVPNVLRPTATEGTALTLEEALKRRRYLPWYVTDGSDVASVRAWMRQAAVGIRSLNPGPRPELQLMVAGPRASRWAEGHDVAQALVATLFARLTSKDIRQPELL